MTLPCLLRISGAACVLSGLLAAGCSGGDDSRAGLIGPYTPPSAGGGDGGGSGGGGGAGPDEPGGALVPAIVYVDGGYPPPFTVSGDGKYVVFISKGDIADENPARVAQLFIVSVETHDVTQLTTRSAADPTYELTHSTVIVVNEDASRVWVTRQAPDDSARHLYEIRPFDPEPAFELISDSVFNGNGVAASDDFSLVVIRPSGEEMQRFDADTHVAKRFLDLYEWVDLVDGDEGFLGISVARDGSMSAFGHTGFVGVAQDEGGMFTANADGSELTPRPELSSGATLSRTGSLALERSDTIVDLESGERTDIDFPGNARVWGGDQSLMSIATEGVVVYDIETESVTTFPPALKFVSGISASSDGSVLVVHEQELMHEVPDTGSLVVHRL